jgi:HWE histidine kinase
MSKALSEGRAQNERWHVRKDRSRFWGSGLVLPLQADGTPGLLKIMRDETARHRADEMKQLLIGELNHRVKNTLGLVQVIAKETLRGRVAERKSAMPWIPGFPRLRARTTFSLGKVGRAQTWWR